jgi:hypothetical protein
MTQQSNEATEERLPEGVIRGNGHDPRFTEEALRRLANDESRLLTQVAGYDEGAAFREAVSPGDTPTDVFTRTEIKTVDDAKFFAVEFALLADELRDDPVWKDEPWVPMKSPIGRAMYLEHVFMMALDRKAKKEGTMVTTHMLAPDLWNSQESNRRRRK